MIDRRTKVTGALGPASALTRVDTSVVRLVVAEGVHKGEAVELKDDVELLLGADATCDLILTDPTVSREHARVSRTDGGVLVKDLGSTNGTYYERGRVREVVVPFGASINLGKQRIKIVPHETAVETAPSTAAKFGSLVGEDRRMRQMFSLLSDVAPTEATVVIEGETGTGKELVASALHQYSSRAKKPFVVFDCSAVPRELIESELFGHVKGSFTGATATRQGVFKRAHQGTIFLDEIGELPLDLQPKLLRALESRAVQMVGADDYQPVDVRVVAATNRNLKQEVRAGRFREDLYYRLAVVRIVLPPLRDRLDDLRTLISHFLTDDEGRRPVIAEESWAALRAYHWPGNVRELKNLAERAKSLSRGDGPIDLSKYLPGMGTGEMVGLADDEITKPKEDVPDGAPAGELGEVFTAVRESLDRESGMSFRDAKNHLIEAFEKRYLTDLIEQTGGNISRAAQTAQMDRKHLRELLKKNGLWEADAG